MAHFRCFLLLRLGKRFDQEELRIDWRPMVWLYVHELASMELIPPIMHDIISYLQPISKMRMALSILGKVILAASSYFICLERNNRMFKQVKKSPEDIRDIIIVTVRLKLLTFCFKDTSMVNQLLARWKMPKSFRIYG
ncbi:hypothetical protein Tco_0953017 [Tanacetum coccineum]|uniref:Uncharacterized protein n=1 Tax=Tanacetum coccineum TaxID=301880 RepID=A0ABQ5DZG0_9ASTR